MADNPIYAGLIRHYLDFVEPNFGRIEIDEPIGFDDFSFNTKQGENRFGRDKSIGAKEIDLTFEKGYRGRASEPRAIFDGAVVNNLTLCFEEIQEAMKRRGSEAEIRYITEVDGVDFVNGQLNLPDSKTDLYSYISCNIVQDTNKAILERKKDLKINVFSTTDTFGNPIEAVAKKKMLLKAVPFVQTSAWKYSFNEPKTFSLSGASSFNFSSQVVTSGVENTLSFIPGAGESEFFKFVYALNEITGLTINITNVDLVKFFGPETKLIMRYGSDINTDFTEVELMSAPSSLSPQVFPTSATASIPVLRRGHYIWIYFKVPGSLSNFRYSSMDVEIKGTSKAFDTVIDTVDYYDFIQYGVKSTSKLPLIAPEFEAGEFSSQLLFSGDMMKRRPDAKLHFVFKDEANDLAEWNADYQINDDSIEIYTFPSFYQNTEAGAFFQYPDEGFERRFNERFKKFSMTYGWDKYEQDKDEKNTVNAFNTELQKQFPNDKVNDKLEVKLKKVRDAFAIETAKKEASKATTSTSNDETIFIMDAIPLAPGTQKTIRGAFLVQWGSDGLIKILSTDPETNETTFSWLTLGFKNGDTISFDTGLNASVLQMSDTVLELYPDFTYTVDTGVYNLEITYTLTDVFLTNRTDEGVTEVENLPGYQFIGNQKYAPERNLRRPGWSSFLHTICADREDGKIVTNYFKSNGAYTSNFNGEGLIRQDNGGLEGGIAVADLAPKILSKYEYSFKIPFTTADGFAQAANLINAVIEDKGSMRILAPSGDDNFPYQVIRVHPKELDMQWATGILEGVGEARNESDYTDIVSVEGGVNILAVGYDDILNTELDWYKIVNGYVQLFDNEGKALINVTYFDRIRIDGTIFTDQVAFANALSAL